MNVTDALEYAIAVLHARRNDPTSGRAYLEAAGTLRALRTMLLHDDGVQRWPVNRYVPYF